VTRLVRETRTCRVCGRGGLFRYLDLGLQPLPNAFRAPEDAISDEPRFPLVLQACPGCKLSQLTHVVPRELMFVEYAYSSGVNPAWHAHCEALAMQFGHPGAFVIDIASNDGTLVRKFAALGCDTVGVEPSTSFDGYNKITQWWTTNTVKHLNLTGVADVITAQNVLGHVDDVHDFMAAVALALKPDGVAIIEVPYVVDLLHNLAFDTVYHEHLSYWSVTALYALARDYGLKVSHVDRLPIHGGSIRVQLCKTAESTDDVERILVDELHILRKPTYLSFSARVTRAMAQINEELRCVTPYYAFGAAAKLTVLLNTLEVRALPRGVFDHTEAKQGKVMPGTQVPVLPVPERLPGPLLLGAWNWADTLVPKLRAEGYRYPIFIPLPRPRWDRV
jgi:SAM-dependent methyltransferase